MIELLKALADENRLRIIQLILQKELCVCEIETMLNMNQSNVSRHLSKLKQAQIIESSKDGQWVHYRIAPIFIENYPGILEHLKVFFQEESSFRKDLSAYKKYTSLGLNCTDIRRDPESVKIKIQI